MAIQITMKCVPELDPEFVPAALWNREYGKLAAADAGRRKLALCVERANGCVSRFDTVILADTPENRALNLRYVERIVKFLLWTPLFTSDGLVPVTSTLLAVYHLLRRG